jgi:hypothetical protein
MEIWNNNGVLTWTMNGAITENVAINTGQPLSEWTKVRIEFRNATKLSPATITLLVNDVLSIDERQESNSAVVASGESRS